MEKDGRLEPEASDAATAVAGEQDNQTQSPRSIQGLKWFLVCMSVYISTFLYGLDTTIAADVQGSLIKSFGNIDQLAWVGAGFPMGSVAIILFVGKLYTIFDLKFVFIGSILLFEIGSAVCGAAPTISALCVGRVIAGCGGSGILTGAINYISHLTTEKERGVYIALVGFHWGMGAVLGPVIGGAFAVSHATWRWAFYINLVIGAAAAPVYIIHLPSIYPHGKPVAALDIAQFDPLGTILSAAMWVAFTLAFIMAGGQWSWSDGRTIATLVVFVVLLALYALQQYLTVFTTKAHRSFPGHLLRSRTQILLYVATSCSITVLFVVVYYIPIYFQFVHGDSSIMAAVRLLPYVVITVTFNLVAGHLLAMVKYYMPIFLTSGLFITLGGALLKVYLKSSTSEASIYGFTVLAAVGTGLSLQLGYSVATLVLPPHDIGNAISMQNVSQIGSSVIALVIASQAFQSTAFRNLRAVLAGSGLSDKDIQSMIAGTQSDMFGRLDDELKQQAIAAIVDAMQKPFILVIVAGAVLVVASAAMKRQKLFGN
ncbi:hypothetical protein NQ176_g715 [Zarea fungicola]|uniref:Uncharacterized protein n=1 Tax=Zarea fungicola TaxID=93591 RepID=A0ACC1NVQ2_9HYPO|nr:hypothetical protein NQ176_g715 [Lecanicillium fungicola]